MPSKNRYVLCFTCSRRLLTVRNVIPEKEAKMKGFISVPPMISCNDRDSLQMLIKAKRILGEKARIAERWPVVNTM